MKVRIYRGTKEIGGTCVELKADNGKTLWIDLGSPLDSKNPNIQYSKNKVDALLISHPHQDHYGLMQNVGNEVPIYIGELSLDLINATKFFIGEAPSNQHFITIKPWVSFRIADTFLITPYLTDHSTPEAFAFLIEADNKRVFYSGDFRATGRKKVVFEKLTALPPKNIDLLLMEGTMVERTNHKYLTEPSIEKAIYEIIKAQENVSFVISSAQNLDRFVSVFRACRKANKYLAIDIYTAWILEMVRKQSKSVPAIEWDEIKVYEHPSQLRKITGKAFDEFRSRIKKQSVGAMIFQKPADYVYFVRCPNESLVKKLQPKGKINILYSQWEGYLKEEHKTYCTDYINRLRKDESNFTFKQVHTSGHATVPDLMKFAKAIKSKKIVPIHTAFPGKFKEKFEQEGIKNVELWEDGKDYQI